MNAWRSQHTVPISLDMSYLFLKAVCTRTSSPNSCCQFPVYCAHLKPAVLKPALMHETLTFIMVFLFGQSAIRRCITPCTRSWKHPPHLLVDILQAIWPYEHSCGISLELKLLINSRWVKINCAIAELLGWGEKKKTCNDSVHYMECQYWLMNIWHTSSHWMTSGCN